MKNIPWFVAILIAACALYALAQQPPIVTGGFPTSGPAATLILVNHSSVPDYIADRASVALSLRVGNVGVAVSRSCGEGEWCLVLTDAMLAPGPMSDPGAAIGAEVTREIVVRSLSR